MRRILAGCLLALALLAAPAWARGLPPDQPVASGVAWSAQGVNVFLTRAAIGDYKLFVANGPGLEVSYLTRVNSSREVRRKLKPLAESNPCLKLYRFSHNFSRTTIWMALRFERDGKPVSELGRAFYGEIKASAPPAASQGNRPGAMLPRIPDPGRK
ncbi:MAG: hypothetical protein KQH53_00375 [Desulfarculaceae bacterium]|nr:hypothetical protein [Desulfarculaceae bacterium]